MRQRIETLVGAPIGALDEDAMQRLVDGSVREDADLDFKESLYGAGDGAKRDLASDVAALANSTGGVIVLGVRELDAVANKLTRVPLSDQEDLRMHQIVAANVAPHPHMTIHRVPSADDPARGWYLIDVPRSPWAPHAVTVGNGLRYPRRDGSSTRWLSEPEVADAYRNRFEAVRDQLARLAQVHAEGSHALPPNDETAWLIVTSSPDLPGRASLSKSLLAETSALLQDSRVPRLAGSVVAEMTRCASVGHRRVVMELGRDHHGTPVGGILHLHTDGSAFAAVTIGFRPLGNRLSDQPVQDAEVYMNDEVLTQETLTLLATVAGHATLCGALGDAAIEVTLRSRFPMWLTRRKSLSRARSTWNERPLPVAPTSRHTIDLAQVAANPQDLLAAGTVCLTDLFQGFGVIETPQIDLGGAIRRPYWSDSAQVDAEAKRLGLETTDETL